MGQINVINELAPNKVLMLARFGFMLTAAIFNFGIINDHNL
jgi:hypothetical protein